MHQLTFLLYSALSAATTPWDTPFQASTSDILREGQSIQPHKNADSVILLDESRIEIDKSGRRTETFRVVVKFSGSKAAESAHANVSREYSPWRQNRPELKARVIDKKGEVHWLDPKTIAEAPANEDADSTIFSDDRRIRVPLPAVADGSIAEYEIKIVEHRPFFDAGIASVRRFWGSQQRQIRVILEAPSSSALRFKTAEIPDTAIQQSEQKNIRKVVLDWTPTPLAADADFDFRDPVPTFSYSTGKSWREVAAGYERIVEGVIANATETKKLTEGIPTGLPVSELAARLTARLHETIRYTGVEFGEMAIVPVTPAVALERKFGDCKDKATLLVAMLRGFEVPAHLALLQSGLGGEDSDVDAALPGLGVFNHAIVYVPGNPPLWIDATADTTPVPQLPISSQGRLALVAAAATNDLVRTPESLASANRRLVEVEVRLKSDGRGEVTEATSATGSFEADLRLSFSGIPKEDAVQLERVAKDIYLAEKLGTFFVPKKDDRSKPYRIEFIAEKTARATTQGDEAAVGIFQHAVLETLPWELLQEKKPEKPSKKNLTLPLAFQSEYRYHILPPPGFKIRTLPKSETFNWGPATYERKFQSKPDGTVEVAFRFDTGKRVYTPSEVELVRAGVSGYATPKPIVLSFLSEAAEASALGDTKAAILSVVKAVQADPKSAAARMRLAKLLIQSASGDAARDEARKATELDPKSAYAYHTVGWTLQHDSFGRRFSGNWDHAAATVAHRKAAELDPRDFVIAMDLAILLEYNQAGQHYGAGAAIKEAEQIYRRLVEETKSPEIRNNLALLLLNSGQYDALEKELPRLDPQRVPTLEMLVAALRESPGRAMVVGQQYFPDAAARGQQALHVAQTLLRMREYPKALDLFKAAGRLMNDPQITSQMEIYSKLKRIEDTDIEKTDPKYPVQRLFAFVFGPQSKAATEEFLSLLSPELARAEDSAASKGATITGDDSFFAEFQRSARPNVAMMERYGMSKALALDMVAAGVQIEVDGDIKTGFRVLLRLPGTRAMPFYVAKQMDGSPGPSYKITAIGNQLEGIGKKILDLAEANDLEPARKLLDWIVKFADTNDGVGTGRPSYVFLWSGETPEFRGKPAILAGGAAVLGHSANSPRAIALLQAALAKSTLSTERNQLSLALGQAYTQAGKWKELLDVAFRLQATALFGREGLEFELRARSKLGQWAEVQKVALAKLKGDKENRQALRALLAAAGGLKDQAKSLEYAELLANSTIAGDDDQVLAAWTSLRLGKSAPKTLKKLAGDASLVLDANHYYVTGLLQVAEKQAEEAIRSLSTGLDRDDFAQLDAQPWVLQGRILEAIGLGDAAARSFDKGKAAQRKSQYGGWAADLALSPR